MMRTPRTIPGSTLPADAGDALRRWRDVRGDAAPTPADRVADARAQALAAERARSSAIVDLAYAANLPKFGLRHVVAGTPLAEFKALLDAREQKGRAARAAREAEAARAEVEAAERRFRALAPLLPRRR